MSRPIRREADSARLAARERRLRLVMRILKSREAEYRRAGQAAPPGLRQSLADYGEQLGAIDRRHAELGEEVQTARPSRHPGRFDRAAAGTSATVFPP